ncbi:hypothetical protein Pst134EA_027683 [Puccinia striiformis f. sp. tritici]|uniref:hypothetical protein n=1 Tax=Puccinia striiformis f. sp. tritici TaxID=168172 RepID=UPI002008DC66|nr:hypothetical protein Pst134EA_027683 [Puccinia striiformis f. sp. tritici]KAH9448371.1 hypothetical protein Pst134EA_027683 [Puccinia striiformis f. sp. tritici]
MLSYELSIWIRLKRPPTSLLSSHPLPSATPSQSTYLLLIPPRSTKNAYADGATKKVGSSSSSQPRVRGVDQVVVEAKPRVKYAPSSIITTASLPEANFTPCPKSVAFNARIELRHTLQYPHLTASLVALVPI